MTDYQTLNSIWAPTLKFLLSLWISDPWTLTVAVAMSLKSSDGYLHERDTSNFELTLTFDVVFFSLLVC